LFVPIDNWGWELSMLHFIVLWQNSHLPGVIRRAISTFTRLLIDS
jgi:hypothetical protein